MAVGMCYLCVVHQTTVSIWRVTGSSPDLTLKQVRKINAAPISQGQYTRDMEVFHHSLAAAAGGRKGRAERVEGNFSWGRN